MTERKNRVLLAGCLLFFILAFGMDSKGIAQTTYSLTDLGDLPGGENESEAFSINNSGVVVGTSSATNGFRPFVWTASDGMLQLEQFAPEVLFANSKGINNFGETVLYAGDNFSGVEGFIGNLENGFVELGLPPKFEYLIPHSINDMNQVVGDLILSLGQSPIAFRWDSTNGTSLLPNFPASTTSSSAKSNNQLGEVVGSVSSDISSCGFKWSPKNGEVKFLIGLGSGGCVANDINDAGQIVGASYLDGLFQACVWENEDAVPLNLAPYPISNPNRIFANAINNQGTIVGFYAGSAERAFVWDERRGTRNVNLLIDENNGMIVTEANDINAAGQIVGVGLTANGERACLLTPISFLMDGLTVESGVISNGGLAQLATSDNMDLTLNRDVSSVQALIVVDAVAVCPNATPDTLKVRLESSVFSRSSVSQTIQLFDFEAQEFETIDSRLASPNVDLVVVADGVGELLRFVDPQTLEVKTRITYSASNRRSRFAANIDQLQIELQ